MTDLADRDSLDRADLPALLARIRARAVELAATGGDAFGALVQSVLPQPLNPVALLPVATGCAVGAAAHALVDAAAAITLADLALRILDDAADGDNPGALDRAIGVGRAVNAAFALQAVVVREMLRLDRQVGSPGDLADRCLAAFLAVGEGQDLDLRRQVAGLDAYRAIVERKTVAAYAFAAVAGACAAGADAASIDTCRRCGEQLGWMVQILDDLESLWFMPGAGDLDAARPGFPLLLGLASGHAQLPALERALREGPAATPVVARLLDAMGVRGRLVRMALDHRDAALDALRAAPHREGVAMLQLWLDWLWRDGARLIEPMGD